MTALATAAAGGPVGRLARAARLVPLPAGAGLARLVVERDLVTARKNLRAIVSGFLEPVFYLFSLGVGLGALVGTVPLADGHQVRYAVFVAPAMLATSAMNGAVFDSTVGVFLKLKYAKVYDAMLATPIGPRALAIGEVAYAQLRGLMYAAAFLLVMLAAGLLPSWWAVLALPAAAGIGLAFAGVGMAATTFMRSWQDFDLITLAMLPMFLFSATFYPISTYPDAVQWVVRLTPLYHAVALMRSLTLGLIGWPVLGHLAYLAVLGVAGTVLAGRRLERLLLT